MNNRTIVFSSYIASIDSPYHDPLDFSSVANAFVPNSNEIIVIRGGNLNGRLGDLPQLRPGTFTGNRDGRVTEPKGNLYSGHNLWTVPYPNFVDFLYKKVKLTTMGGILNYGALLLW